MGVKLASFYGPAGPDESLNFVETGGGLPAASHMVLWIASASSAAASRLAAEREKERR